MKIYRASLQKRDLVCLVHSDDLIDLFALKRCFALLVFTLATSVGNDFRSDTVSSCKAELLDKSACTRELDTQMTAPLSHRNVKDALESQVAKRKTSG